MEQPKNTQQYYIALQLNQQYLSKCPLSITYTQLLLTTVPSIDKLKILINRSKIDL